jgi:hypothetical protein
MAEQSLYTRGAREGKCRSCYARVWWCRNPDGTDQILDYEPVPNGNIRFIDMGKIEYATKAKPIPLGIARYRSHFATCPNREKHRKKPRPAPTQVGLSLEIEAPPEPTIAQRKYQ